MNSIFALLTGGKGPNEDTIQNRKNKTMNEDKIIITEDGEEINLTTLECEFGSYELEGKTYYAARQMEPTSRLFPDVTMRRKKERNTSLNTLHRDMTKTEPPWKSS